MTRIVWDQLRTRTYETGVDRGVLYPTNSPGVSWPGLVRIDENYSGLDVNSRYFDGQKYATSIGKADFGATLAAYSYPEEFAACDGRLEIGSGLFAMQQPRQLFGLSYRTLIGNDTQGNDHGYKIHLVYNVLATPNGIADSTISSDPTPTVLEWTLNTIPYREREFAYFKSGGDQTKIEEQKEVYRPTAHMIVDSRAVGPAKLTHLENVMYGTDLTDPELPTPSELLEIIS